MAQELKSIPKWILIVSGLFSLLGIIVSSTLIFSPQSALQTVDINAKGVDYLIYMWAARQFAVGFIFGFATFKKSVPMLTLAYLFFLVMNGSRQNIFILPSAQIHQKALTSLLIRKT